MKNRIPLAVAAVAQLATLGVVVVGWRRLIRQAQRQLARVATLELRIDDVENRYAADSIMDMIKSRRLRGVLSQDTPRGRHLASVTALRPTSTPGGESS